MNDSDRQLLAVLAREFGVHLVSVKAVVGGFSGARLFHVSDEAGKEFALRLTPKEHAIAPERISLLHQLISFLAAQEYSIVPVPLQLRQRVMAEFRIPVDGEWPATILVNNGQLVQLERWQRGCSVELPTESQLQETMRRLSEFHRLARRWGGVIAENPWFYVRHGPSPGLQRRLQLLLRLDSGLLRELETAAATDSHAEFRTLARTMLDVARRCVPGLIRAVEPLKLTSFALSPVIRDLWREHLLFTGDHLTGLIDLTAAATDHVVLDLARLLRSWYETDCRAIGRALNFYAAEAAISEPEYRLFQALDHWSVLLSPLTWLQRRYCEGRWAETQNDRVMQRVTSLVRIAQEVDFLRG
ncbi:MAG: phosphotransferase [Planctomycetaceae bacterium]|nr:phosphotransferase [Planctomycetaceae bacterium]